MELLHLAPETLHYHCPYNPSHTMPHKTLIKHLSRCPEKPVNFRSCIYNLSHAMHESELQNHEENCPDRILFDTTVFESEDLVRPTPIVSEVPIVNYEDESWEGMEHSADVLKDISKKTIAMKAKHGSTKSERKSYRTYLHTYETSNNREQIENKMKKDHKQKSEKTPLFIGKRPNIVNK